MNSVLKPEDQLRNEVSMDPSFDRVARVAWAMDAAKGQRPSDNAIQENFDQTRELIEDGEYVVLPPHIAHDDEVGFPLLGEDASDDDVAAQEAEIKQVIEEGKTPFHYETCYVRYVIKASEKNPNRPRLSRGRGRANRSNVVPG